MSENTAPPLPASTVLRNPQPPMSATCVRYDGALYRVVKWDHEMVIDGRAERCNLLAPVGLAGGRGVLRAVPVGEMPECVTPQLRSTRPAAEGVELHVLDRGQSQPGCGEGTAAVVSPAAVTAEQRNCGVIDGRRKVGVTDTGMAPGNGHAKPPVGIVPVKDYAKAAEDYRRAWRAQANPDAAYRLARLWVIGAIAALSILTDTCRSW